MVQLSNSEIQNLAGGFGYFPGYDRDAHIRAGNLLVGGTVGVVTGFVEGLWNTLVDYSK